MIKILFIGPQGSGKSTQAKLLAQFLGLPYISTGDIFRKLSFKDSEEGQRVRKILESGELVDDKETAEIIKRRVQESDCQNGFVFDGYPRNLKQIEFFDPGFDKVFYLKLSDEEASKRLVARGREDDTPELIAERLRIYHKQTDPILEYYQNRGSLVSIDGRGTIDEIQQKIREAV